MNLIFAQLISMTQVSFNNTEIAFQHKSDRDLRRAKWLFSLFNHKWLIRFGPSLAVLGLRLGLPIKGLIRNTIFKQFCGGESILQCQDTSKMLRNNGVGSILDYSVEGVDEEASFEQNCLEIIRTIDETVGKEQYPFAVFKPTGIGCMALLTKVQSGANLTNQEAEEYSSFKGRFYRLCDHAAERDVRLFVDAEDSWIQDPVDALTTEMMQKHNLKKAVIFNTLQMYRHDRLAYLKEICNQASGQKYFPGFKLVRGAYMEKERARAVEMGYASPIQPDKEATDRDYNEAVKYCFEHRNLVSMCVATHNEQSATLLVDLMSAENIEPSDERFWFAQLYGMSDNISFNLAHAGYNVAKYLPYGPLISVMPYLGRRAMENSSVSGQVGREMALIVRELQRRRG